MQTPQKVEVSFVDLAATFDMHAFSKKMKTVDSSELFTWYQNIQLMSKHVDIELYMRKVEQESRERNRTL